MSFGGKLWSKLRWSSAVSQSRTYAIMSQDLILQAETSLNGSKKRTENYFGEMFLTSPQSMFSAAASSCSHTKRWARTWDIGTILVEIRWSWIGWNTEELEGPISHTTTWLISLCCPDIQGTALKTVINNYTNILTYILYIWLYIILPTTLWGYINCIWDDKIEA